MTNRVLLTLLALLTGLSVQGSAVQARELASQRVAVSAAGMVAEARQAEFAHIVLKHAGSLDLAAFAVEASCAPVSAAKALPAVLVGIDRARE